MIIWCWKLIWYMQVLHTLYVVKECYIKCTRTCSKLNLWNNDIQDVIGMKLKSLSSEWYPSVLNSKNMYAERYNKRTSDLVSIFSITVSNGYIQLISYDNQWICLITCVSKCQRCGVSICDQRGYNGTKVGYVNPYAIPQLSCW